MDLFKISKILSRDDVIYLIKQLYEKLDNKSKISKITGLTRRILDKYYNEEIKDIKEKTKFRLLGASFKYNREYTLNFILEHLKHLIASAAYSNLDFFYEILTTTKSDKEFREYYVRFISHLYENKFYLIKNYRDEIMGFSNYLEYEHRSLLTILIPPTTIIKNAEREESLINNLKAQIRYFPFLSAIKTTQGDQEDQTILKDPALKLIPDQSFWTTMESGGNQDEIPSPF